jgi:hypothetical protein
VSVTQETATSVSTGRRFRAYTSKHLEELTTRAGLSADERLAVRAVATVLPFRVNAYVVDELIDWDAAPDDPIYRLTFPQADMLPPDDLATIADLIRKDVSKFELNVAANKVRARLNPHPAGQLELNLPKVGDEPLVSASSTSTPRPSCSSRSRARRATHTACTASGGPSSSASAT